MQLVAPQVRLVWPAVDARRRTSLGAAMALALAQAAFVVLFTNVPAGYKNPAWLTREAVDLFGQVWSYPRLALDPGRFPAMVAAAIAVSWLAYLVAARARPTPGVVFGVAAAVELLLLFMPPVLSSDLFLYGAFGRMIVFGASNPYVATGGASADPIAAFTQWSGKASLYGPVWTYVSAAVSLAVGRSVFLTALGFKVVAAVCHLLNGGLVYAIARRLGADAPKAALLYLWNPLILLESAGSGHNDALMVALVLGGILAATAGRRTLACTLVALAVLVKYLPLLLLFLLAIHWAASATSWRGRVIELARPAVVMSIVAALLYAPFLGGGADFLAPISDYSSGHFHTPVRVGLLQVAPPAAVSTGLTITFVLVALRLAYLVWRRPSWSRVVVGWAAGALYYVAVVYPWNFPWYVVTPLASAAPLHATRRGGLIFALAAAAGAAWTWIQYGVLIPL